MKFSFGSDPEFMILDEDNQPISAIGIIKGNRDQRLKIGKHEYYYDNVLAECAIAPGKTKADVLVNMRQCLGKLKELVLPNYFAAVACREYESSQLNHKDARTVGCSVEQCAYDLRIIEPPTSAIADSNVRTAGGHIHIGCPTAMGEYGGLFVVRMLDLFLALPALLFDHDKTAAARRKIYGQAGRYRVKPYGIEYRTLSNFWLSSPKYVNLTYDICDFALQFCEDKKYLNFWSIDEKKLRDVAFYEAGGREADCHKCSLYEIEDLKAAIAGNKPKAEKLLEISLKLMPVKIKNEINKLSEDKRKVNLYREWNIE